MFTPLAVAPFGGCQAVYLLELFNSEDLPNPLDALQDMMDSFWSCEGKKREAPSKNGGVVLKDLKRIEHCLCCVFLIFRWFSELLFLQ